MDDNIASLAKIPGVTSFQRGLIVSDGTFFNVGAESGETPLEVIRHGIRGTQNVNKESSKARDVSNIQITETARTSEDATAFGVRFGLRFLPIKEAIHSCAGDEAQQMREHFQRFVTSAVESDGLAEVSRRIARNILNGRWLWRNRSLGQRIDIKVVVSNKADSDRYPADTIQSAALDVPLLHFNDYSDDEKTLAGYIQGALAGDKDAKMLSFAVEAVIDAGFKGSIEVFPSQNYVENKPKGFARPLYKVGRAHPVNAAGSNIGFNDVRVMGIAALRDQKIGNALRTIDTWYPGAEDNDYEPIAIEPEGASLNAMQFFRKHKAKGGSSSSFRLARDMGNLDPNSDDGKYMIGCLIRGGVYGETGKSDSAEKASK
ncbi:MULTISPECIES: type I-F CRISPR-associated protein Csy3 [unclassified Thioalkalivibrio]|uniref:type I-F CRISPR-associated protein Csy3 n=1 Tax=unclassified Thioalkalivibrio TaxID=2621013 RepID=UPI0003790F1C|nr:MULTISPECIES: type I-F CRISPR-associated protein Csy3 [unclassified Thioalkalivibrio]